jgi:hypothetical protein
VKEEKGGESIKKIQNDLNECQAFAKKAELIAHRVNRFCCGIRTAVNSINSLIITFD